MDKVLLKRGVGAIALALVAALILSYLINGKRNEREQVVDMALPVASNDSIAPVETIQEEEILPQEEFKLIDEKLPTQLDSKGQIAQIGTGITTAANQLMGQKDDADKPKLEDNPLLNKEKVVDGIEAGDPNGVKEIVAIAKSTPAENKKPAPKAVAPKAVAPKAVAPKAVAPKAVAPKATAAPATAQPTSTGAYTIQLLATSSETRANKLKSVFGNEGYKVSVISSNNAGKVLYRVRVGNYTDKAAAVAAQTAMKRRYQKRPDVQNSYVTR